MANVLEFLPSASNELRKLPKTVRGATAPVLKGLKENATPTDAELLSAEEGIYRIRVGYYYVLYQVHQTNVTVLKIGNRKQLYQHLLRMLTHGGIVW